MNRTITFLAMCLTVIVASAQTADIEVSYEAHHPNLRDGKTDLTNHYVLLANTTESKFFSPVTEYLDSLNSTPDGKAKLNEMTRSAYLAGKLDDIPRPDGTIYVIKSFADNKIRHYDTAGLEKFVYEEPVARWDWETGDSTKVILGYECLMATTGYHGRKWTAWFTPEIPVQNGPWKLDGLPGLILQASAEGGQYSFIATGIQESARPIVPVYLANDYEKTERIGYLKSKRAFMDNPMGKINARFGGAGVTIKSNDEEQLKQLFVPASVADFIETDYH